jgi:hypothetical protein
VSIPGWQTRLVDDAAIFPPGNVPLDRAVAEHHGHRTSEYADLVGGFVVSDVKVPDLVDVLDDRDVDDETPLGINLVVTGGAGAIEPAVRWATRAPVLRLTALECSLRDEDDLARNAQRVTSVLDQLAADLDGVDVYVEPPRLRGEPTHGWLAALDVLAEHEVRLKLRTGGLDQDAFPTSGELADTIDAALDRELSFKCTAGLHHAVRHVDAETGLTHHGFLNVLLATRACLDGNDGSDVLAEESPRALLDGLDLDALASTRRWFRSFGSCSVLEPHDDLVELGLIAPAGVAS